MSIYSLSSRSVWSLQTPASDLRMLWTVLAPDWITQRIVQKPEGKAGEEEEPQ